MKASDYDKILKEHFDCDDTETRKIMISIDEADQNAMVNSLTSKIYDHIVKKVDDIEYGTIPESEGDITKVEKFEQTIDCIDCVRKYMIEYKQDTKMIDEIQLAIENIKNRKDVFERCFKLQIEFGMVVYCNLVLMVEGTLHLLILSTIEFIKNPGNDNFSATVDKVKMNKTKSGLLFNNLEKFNKSCKKGEFDDVLSYIISKSEKHFMGSTSMAVAGGIAIGGLVLNIVPIMRELIFYFYSTRTSISDYFETQADLLQMNAYNIEHNVTNNVKAAKDIAAKQMKLVTKFRKVANFVAIDNKQAEKNTTKEISNSAKKYKVDELTDERPDSALSTGSLF